MSLFDPARLREALAETEPLVVQGRIVRAAGLVLEAALPGATMGAQCDILAAGGKVVPAEVVGFDGSTALLMPFAEAAGIGEGSAVIPRRDSSDLPVGPALLGRVVDPSMRPLDGGPAPLLTSRVPLQAAPPPAMSRRRISAPLPLGIRALDTFLTLGEGQRLGILAGAGVGKSVLLGMLSRSAEVDVVVVGLVGERGREVREFVERDLGPEGRARSVVVVATSDEPPLIRIRAAMAATAVAEHFRARGKRVLLLMDSLTRVAMAQREVGLAAGEPPTSKGYPPSVFAMMPRLLERAGNDAGEGSITAIYTVLAEGDDLTDPVVDTAKSILDGHVVLSRKLAGAGHFPAIDLLASVSRVMTEVASPRHLELATAARQLLSAHREAADLIEVGVYAQGTNPKVDRAIRVMPALEGFLRQAPDERTGLGESLTKLAGLLSTPGEPRHA
ncbi:FliI/YscN family ATPase [Vulgatibacter incomptus]|uniref:Flagellum-specific ATP synthase n=1 Tax=Vulgatibacter incomptus TaxID=1391653 RepID=A0A0K1PHM9_9BACT|nr:FliI/YscN family ATPase [Vulgatibacter incomptus]AKU93025.1 Flagellum-specific ATP synthase FliI [Vulgatibacter incomptus]